jgi:hypothetical protein
MRTSVLGTRKKFPLRAGTATYFIFRAVGQYPPRGVFAEPLAGSAQPNRSSGFGAAANAVNAAEGARTLRSSAFASSKPPASVRKASPSIGQARRRREFITLIGGAAAWPLAAGAQQPSKVWRIGFIAGASRPASLEVSQFGGFQQGMREHGYVEGKDFVIEWRFADANPSAIRSLALSSCN